MRNKGEQRERMRRMTLLLIVLVAITIYYIFLYKDTGRFNNSLHDVKRCPNCKNRVEYGFNVCPVCRETLKKACTFCGEMTDISWKYCPYCEKPLTKSESK